MKLELRQLQLAWAGHLLDICDPHRGIPTHGHKLGNESSSAQNQIILIDHKILHDLLVLEKQIGSKAGRRLKNISGL